MTDATKGPTMDIHHINCRGRSKCGALPRYNTHNASQVTCMACSRHLPGHAKRMEARLAETSKALDGVSLELALAVWYRIQGQANPLGEAGADLAVHGLEIVNDLIRTYRHRPARDGRFETACVLRGKFETVLDGNYRDWSTKG